jgi:S1-C subfamily serine protease
VERGVLGATGLVNITPTIAQELNLAVESGVGVGSVEGGSPADKAGLKRGDIIVRAAGQDIANSGDLLRVLTEHRSGEKVTVEYYRGGERKQTEVTLG